MTTEVLRSMLYRGSEIVREAALVVFDEIHYIKDPERGVVWEECIVLLPRGVRCAFLSATIPNAEEFAAWVARVHSCAVSVIHTEYRPTPLQHYIFPAGGDGIHLVVDDTGRFREDNFTSALAVVAANAQAAQAMRDARMAARAGGREARESAAQQQGPQRSDMYKLVNMLLQRSLGPVIVFSFSKRECEANGAQLHDLDLLEPEEKKAVDHIFTSAMDSLAEEDRRLPQVANALPALRRGVGVHHSGMLPVVKECVEILFAEGLLRVLCATETFSTGLNMPARTVVFTSARKFDGAQFRWLSSGEYIQMSGRAGRRGLDARGTVVLCLDERMDAAVAKDMLRGAPDSLFSAFHLTYATLLNVMRSASGAGAAEDGGKRVDGSSDAETSSARPEALLRASYRQFQAERAVPLLQARAEALRSRAAHAREGLGNKQQEQSLRQLAAHSAQLHALRSEWRAVCNLPHHAVPFLQPGRVCRVCMEVPGKKGSGDGCEDTLVPDDEDIDADDGIAGSAQKGGSPNGPLGGVSASNDAAADAALDAECAAVVARATAELAARRTEEGEGDASATPAPNAEIDSAWGIIVNFERIGGDGAKAQYAVDVLLRIADSDDAKQRNGSAGGGAGIRILPMSSPANTGAPRVVQVPLGQLDRLAQIRLRLPPDLRPAEARATVAASLGEVLRRFPGGVPLLDPTEDMKVDGGSEFRKLERRIEALDALVRDHQLSTSPQLPALLGALARVDGLERRAEAAAALASSATQMVLRDELKARRRVLRKLGYTDEEGVVQVKGRVAAEVASCDELVATELMFNGVFSELDPPGVAALASCLIWRDKAGGGADGGAAGQANGGIGKRGGQQQPKLRDELASAFARLRDTARRVSRTEQECRLISDADAYVDSFKCELMELVFSWAKGARFADLLQAHAREGHMFEGTVVRAIRRLEELLRQLSDGALAIGEQQLGDKFQQAATLLRRDIVFAASLFL